MGIDGNQPSNGFYECESMPECIISYIFSKEG